MNKNILNQLESGDYNAICMDKGKCIIHIKQIPNGLGGCCTSIGCSMSTNCTECIADEGYGVKFDIKDRIK